MAKQPTFRPQNVCRNPKCGYEWQPRGHDVALRCPRCGCRDVGTNNPSVLAGCLGLIVLIIIGAIYSAFKSDKPDSSSNRPASAQTKTEPKGLIAAAKQTPTITPNEPNVPKIEPVKKREKQDEPIVEKPKRPPIDPAEEEKRKKEHADADATFRLSAIKTFVQTGKPEVALRYAKDLVRLYPDSPQAEEAQAIIKKLMEND